MDKGTTQIKGKIQLEQKEGKTRASSQHTPSASAVRSLAGKMRIV
jgi:hypothetical protein